MHDPNASKPLAMSIKRAAATLDVSRTTIWRMIKTGKLQAVHVGRRHLVVASSIDRLLSEAMTANGR